MKIVVVGAGYVGMSMAVLLSVNNDVILIDNNKEKVKILNDGKSTIKDDYIDDYLINKKLNLKASLSYKNSIEDANFIIISTPTDYDESKNYFNTSSIINVLDNITKYKTNATIVIKSTIPVGFIDELNSKYDMEILFSPEFLREGNALYDNLYPSRIIVSPDCKNGRKFGSLLKDSAVKKDVPVLYMSPDEAACVKLFSNSYLAMRISFFNELDTYAIENNLSTKNIINGVCLDRRIGDYYNNPSFGYGGYCLPKDTKQLLANYKLVPQSLIENIIKSNAIRKDYIADQIIKKNSKKIGIYRLTMKKNSDNLRSSSIFDIINKLVKRKIKIYIYEPYLNQEIDGCTLIKDINKFKKISDIIITNRYDSVLDDVKNKVYTRDLYGRD